MPQNLYLFPKLICRTPVFDLNSTMGDSFNELKNYIGDASPSFLQQIEHTSLQELHEAGDTRMFALWKYFNRARYRSTPFARFAAVTVVPLHSVSNTTVEAQIESNLKVHRFRDWDDANALQPTVTDNLDGVITTNYTWYKVGNEHRFITLIDNQYELCRIDDAEIIDFVANSCSAKIERDVLTQLIRKKFNISKTAASQLIDDLISNQLLWTEAMPNLTGDDYFKRINAANETANHYIISERKLIKGAQEKKDIEHLPALINLLNQHVPAHPDAHLEQFRSQFIRKFDRAFIPLSVALDPELGIDFATLSGSPTTQKDQLPVAFPVKSSSKHPPAIQDGPLATFLLNCMTRGSSVINLEDFKTAEENTTPALPNTLTAVYHLYKNQPVLHSIGGCTANAMLGRFTLCGDEMTELAQNIADLEIQANPDVVFFDVSFQAEKHVDNINRRQHLYQAELSLSGWSTHENPLRLNDVYVGVRHNQIILYSAKLNCRIIPRIASAYNYQRANLTVYSFLATLQHQETRPYLGLFVPDYFPGLDHYPRIQFQNIVVFPETWRVPPDMLKSIKNAGNNQTSDTLKKWLHSKNIKQRFHAGKGDQKLIFDPQNTDDLKYFAAYCKQHTNQSIYLSEALIDAEQAVMDEKLKAYFSESVLPVFHNSTVYQHFTASWLSEINHNYTSRKYYPGDDWNYTEIYCHPARTNTILTNAWKQVLKENKRLLKQWFFIRYTDGGNHLRLRFQLKDKDKAYQIIKALKAKLQQELSTGLITDVQLKTYVREVERYHHGGIDNAENFFHEDSKRIIILLGRFHHTDDLYDQTIYTMQQLITNSFKNEQQQLQFAKTIAQRFSDEMDFNTIDFKSINKCYRAFRTAYPITQSGKLKYPARYFSTFNNYLSVCSQPEAIAAFTADAIHMHINRLFSSNQRQHEAILYQYLFNDMKRCQMSSVQQVQSLN